MHSEINKTEIEKIILEADDLPSLPFITQKILKLTLEPEQSLKDISKVVSQDAALSARFLKIVNSAYYGFASDIKDIQQAVSMLGVMAIRNIAITLSLFDVFPIHQSKAYKVLFKRALTAAIAADFIAQIDGKKAPHDVFLAGLLQNLGKFILLRYLPDQYSAVLDTAKKYGLNLLDVEEINLGITHIKAGSVIGKRWNLPVIVRASLEYKNDIQKAMQLNIPDSAKLLIKSTYLGGIVADIFWSWNKVHSIAMFKNELNMFFECDPNTADDILSTIPHLVSESGFFEEKGEEIFPSFNELMDMAENELLQSPFTSRSLYKKYVDIMDNLAGQEVKLKTVEDELAKSNALVQKLALKLKE